MKLLSIAIPCYNSEAYMEKCIDSLLVGGEEVEILIVDDGSKDGTTEIADRYQEKYPTIVKAVAKPNGGHGDAVNCGLAHATGKYFKVVDSDDWVEPQMVVEMIPYVTGSNSEIVSSDYMIERDNGTSEPVYQQLVPGEYNRETLLKKVLPFVLGQEHRYVTISRCMKLISRKLVLDNMKYCQTDIRMGEDLTLLLPCLLDCEHLVVMNHKAYYHYLYVTESMAHQYDKGLYENNRKLREIIHHILEKKCCNTNKIPMPDYAWMLDQADREYLFLLLLALKNEARGNPSGSVTAYRSDHGKWGSSGRSVMLRR